MKKTALALVLVLTAGGALAAKKVTTWMDPNAKGKTFRNVAVFVLAHDKQAGRTAERMLASTLTGTTKAVPGNSFVAEDQYKDKEKVVALLKEKGFDAAVVAKVVAVDETKGQSSVTGYVTPYNVYGVAYYDGFTGYWGTFAPVTYVGGYAFNDKVVQVETVLYDIGTNGLVWAMQQGMKNPESTLEVIEKVSKKAVSELRSAKLIAK